jgi:hypothetical protein
MTLRLVRLRRCAILLMMLAGSSAVPTIARAQPAQTSDVSVAQVDSSDEGSEASDAEERSENAGGAAPDEGESGNFVIVPIPLSDPTLGTGIVLGGAYFYPQTAEQAASQPASLTAAGVMQTNTNSSAFAIGQRNYWNGDTWRFDGILASADLRLPLTTSDALGGQSVDWRVNGGFARGKLMRRMAGSWYGGVSARWVEANQLIDLVDDQFDLGDVRTVGVGLNVEYDTRDEPTNAYSGQHLTLDALFNDETLGSQNTYQHYDIVFRSYHELSDSLVLAWEARGCQRNGDTPLWDACIISLRGFPATDYLGVSTASLQAEARYRFNPRWGVVGFAGAGYVADSFSALRDEEPIPSYGVGIRFMVQPEKRINIRLDYARSNDSDAIHFGVAEAF